MAVELPYFDYDQLSDNVRSRLRLALRDDQKLSAAVTYGEGEAFLGKIVSVIAEETRRMVSTYQGQIEEIVESAATNTDVPSVEAAA